MNLYFDKGTIVLEALEYEKEAIKQISLVSWDPRNSIFRGKAMHYNAIREALIKNKIVLNDYIHKNRKLSGSFNEITLRPYQEMALLEWKINKWRGIVVLPTGSGKTLLAIKAIKELNVPTLILVPTRILLHQWKTELWKCYNSEIGLIGDEEWKLKEITITTFESAYRAMSKIGKFFSLLVVDEAHHFGLNLKTEVFDMSIATFRLGLAAKLNSNPLEKEKLTEAIGPVIYEMDINRLKGEFLSDFDYYELKLPLSHEERNRYELAIEAYRKFLAVFKTKNPNFEWPLFIRLASQCAEGRKALNGLKAARKILSFTKEKEHALSQLLKRHEKDKLLVFTGDKKTAYTISQTFLIQPITADVKKNEREIVFQNFKTGKLRALVSCKVLNEGIDVPDASVAIIVGGSASELEQVQRVGRILRPMEGKKAIIYELISDSTMEEGISKRRGKTFDSRLTITI